MADELVQNEEKSRAAKLRQEQNSARRLEQFGKAQTATGKKMRTGGNVTDNAGRKVRAGGQKMMQTGAKMSGSLVGAIGGVPLMAVGGLTTALGAGAQGAGKLAKGAGRGVEKGGRVAKLKARVNQKKIAQRRENEAGLTSGLEKKATGGALRAAWLSLIPSWGLTLLYINVHVFLSWIFPKQFCSLGQEWGSLLKGKKGAAARVGEGLLLVSLDFLALFIIFGLLAIFIWLVRTLSSPTGSVKAFFQSIF